MPFLSQKASSAVAGGTGGGYLNPSKIQSGSSVRFALLSDQPLEFFECWGEAEDGSVKPFRFAEDPSDADIKEEMGDAYSRRLNREGTAPEGVKFAIAGSVNDARPACFWSRAYRHFAAQDCGGDAKDLRWRTYCHHQSWAHLWPPHRKSTSSDSRYAACFWQCLPGQNLCRTMASRPRRERRGGAASRRRRRRKFKLRN